MYAYVKRLATAGTLAAALLLAGGCDTVTEPPVAPTGPSVEERSELLGGLTDGLLGGDGLSYVRNTLGDITKQVVSGVVTPFGGTLEVLGHQIVVPAGAVSRPTLFVMSALPTSEIQVELYAFDVGTWEDVGDAGFEIPVQLSLSYDAAQVDHPERLVIVHVRRDGKRIPLPSVVDTENRRVTASLDHFSRYALCSN